MHRRRLPASSLAALAIAALTSACTPLPEYRAAQAPAPAPAPVPARVEDVAAGERVQVHHRRPGRDERFVRGRVLESDSAAIRLVAERGDTVIVARGELRGLWVSRGRRPRATTAAIGFLVGAVAGGAIGYASGDECAENSLCLFERGETGMAGAFAGALLGGVIGALVGGGENWKRVPVGPSAALRFGPAPAPGGGVSLVRLELPGARP